MFWKLKIELIKLGFIEIRFTSFEIYYSKKPKALHDNKPINDL